MNAWKEKVADKLSRLLADSSSTHDPLSSKLISSAEKEPPPSATSYSSYVLSALQKASSNVGKAVPDKSMCCPDSNSSSLPTVSTGWTNQNFSCKEGVEFKKVDSESGNDDWNQIEKEKKGFILQHNMETSILPREEFSSYDSEKYIPVLLHNSTLISLELFEFLQASLPNMVKGCQWVLLYRTALQSMGFLSRPSSVRVRAIKDLAY